MKVHRLSRRTHESTALNGEGARLYGGRWNLPATPMVYTSSTTSLALLEVLAGTNDYLSLKATPYIRYEITLDDALINTLDEADLPDDWQEYPAPFSTQDLGSNWHNDRQSVALIVPSVVITHEDNILLNISHPDFQNLVIEGPIEFSIDPRLMA